MKMGDATGVRGTSAVRHVAVQQSFDQLEDPKDQTSRGSQNSSWNHGFLDVSMQRFLLAQRNPTTFRAWSFSCWVDAVAIPAQNTGSWSVVTVVERFLVFVFWLCGTLCCVPTCAGLNV